MAGNTNTNSPPCPECGGETEERANQWGAFWGCVEFHETGCRGLVPLGRPQRPRARVREIERGARQAHTLSPRQAAELRTVREAAPDGGAACVAALRELLVALGALAR